MIPIIHKMSEKSKSLRARYSYGVWYTKNRLFLLRFCMIFFMCMISFLLGKLSSINPVSTDIDIIYPDLSVPRAVYIPDGQRSEYRITTPSGLGNAETNTSITNSSQNSLGNFVASKNGSKYYPVNCKSASRIKPENQIFFASSTEATSRGYVLSDQCTSSQ